MSQKAWNKGLKGFRAGEKRPSVIGKGELNGCWKGEKVGYRGLHVWVSMMLGKPVMLITIEKRKN